MCHFATVCNKVCDLADSASLDEPWSVDIVEQAWQVLPGTAPSPSKYHRWRRCPSGFNAKYRKISGDQSLKFNQIVACLFMSTQQTLTLQRTIQIHSILWHMLAMVHCCRSSPLWVCLPSGLNPSTFEALWLFHLATIFLCAVHAEIVANSQPRAQIQRKASCKHSSQYITRE